MADFAEVRKNAKGQPTVRMLAPPYEVLKNILSLPAYENRHFPPLEMLASTPLLGSDGRILSRAGYYKRERIYLSPTVEVPTVPARPTRDDVSDALRLLLEIYLDDFPFSDDASRAHALAVILTPLVRRLIQGPTPLLFALASTPGTGKSLLMTALSLIVAGRPADPTPLRSSEEEMAKTLLAVLIAGPTYLFFDNLTRADSGTLASVIASPDCRFAGRLLGASRWVEVPALSCWLASGNNPTLSRELARRTVAISLDANLERPWQRSQFRIPRLVRWGLDNRSSLLHATLVLCRAWVAAGCPKGHATLGSFESWADCIGGILDVAGVGGFLENRDLLLVRDEEGLSWSALVSEWWRQFQTRLVAIDELHEIIVRNQELEVAFSKTLGQGLDRSQKKKLAEALRAVENRVFGSWRIEVVLGHTVRGLPLYQLVPLALAPARTREPGEDDGPAGEQGWDDEGDAPGGAPETWTPF